MQLIELCEIVCAALETFTCYLNVQHYFNVIQCRNAENAQDAVALARKKTAQKHLTHYLLNFHTSVYY